MPFLIVAVDTRVKKFREKLNNMKCRNDLLREVLAEFLGTFLLTVSNGFMNENYLGFIAALYLF